MKLRTYSSEGVILQRKNYGEADRILTVFSKDFGKVTFLAKSVRKLKSRKRGHLEVFSHIKFQVATGKGFDILTEAETINSFELVRTNLNRVALAYYFCEVINKITKEGEKHSELFNLLIHEFKELEISKNLKNLRKIFIQNLLIELGYWPKDKIMMDPDLELLDVLEGKINSLRVGKKVVV